MLRLPLAAGALVTLLATAAGAAAATPSTLLAKRLKHEMQAFYDKRSPGLELTTVDCRIARGGTSAHCAAHFTIATGHAVGIFQVAATIDPATGGVRTKTTSVRCTDVKTGAAVGC